MSAAYGKDKRTTFFAQQVGRGGTVNETFEVLIEREATLDERLAEIQERRLLSITLLIHPGFEDVRVCRFKKADALALYHALGDALMACDGEGES